jgi:hypothetical protein
MTTVCQTFNFPCAEVDVNELKLNKELNSLTLGSAHENLKRVNLTYKVTEFKELPNATNHNRKARWRHVDLPNISLNRLQ